MVNVRRQAEKIEMEAAREGARIRLWRHREAFLAEFRVDECVDAKLLGFQPQRLGQS
jgi:hypothetical protein